MATLKSDSLPVDGALMLVNQLRNSGSPYVRAHMSNPVAWQTWCPETLDLAKQHNRLIFVSIGYAACHWCHVMERESFLSAEVANILNASFIPIKIDREERPDIDAIYMNYVEATTGSGGWPLNVFLTPDLEPVFGGTYWPGPNNSATGTMSENSGFVEILEKMRDVWTRQEVRCRISAKEITKQLKEFAEEGVHSHAAHQLGEKREGEGLEIELLEEAYQYFEKRYDKLNGGFSAAPKFPTPVKLSFLLRLSQWPAPVRDIVGEEECINAATMAIQTLRKMARGGIRDQIGNGFARYSVTNDWSLPHFEKMLYDQAQLLDVYLDAFLITHDPEMLGALFDIAAYLTSPPIAAPGGGFHSAEDADSLPTRNDKEKREGAYYVWTLKELHQVLDAQSADLVAAFYGISADGNVAPQHDPHDDFAAQNVVQICSTPAALSKDFGIPKPEVARRLNLARTKLREHREAERPRPAVDDKIVTAWNGLAIGALARASAALKEVDAEKASTWLSKAKAAAEFIKTSLYDQGESGLLWRAWREGRHGVKGLADDYAGMVYGLVELYEATFEERWLKWADELQKKQIAHFLAPTGGFYTSPNSSATISTSDLLLRLKTGMDSDTPSANSVSAMNLYRLSSLLEDESYAKTAKETVLAFEAEIEQWPGSFPGLLGSVVWENCGGKAIVIAGGIQTGNLTKEDLKSRGEEIGVGRTVLRVRKGESDVWIKRRNRMAGALQLQLEENVKVLVCAEGTCRELKEGESW